MTLTNVKHVPKLKRSLISLRALNTLGYAFSTKNNIIISTKVLWANVEIAKIWLKLFIFYCQESQYYRVCVLINYLDYN